MSGEDIEAGALRERLTALPALPPFPSTLEILLRQPESPSTDALKGCLRRDPALLAHLLRRRDALCAPEILTTAMPVKVVIGDLAPVLAAALIANPAAFDGGPEDACASIIWPRALRTACLAESLIGMTNAAPGASGKAFELALLLDLGAMALYRLDPTGYAHLLREHARDLPALLTAERAHFGMTHSLAGRIVADAWEMPAEIRRHVWFQYQPRPAPGGSLSDQVLPLALHWARRCAWQGQPDEWEQAAVSFGVELDALREAIESAEDRAAALIQSAPAAAAEPEAFRARLGLCLATRAQSAPPEALEWAEQALMAGEAEPPRASAMSESAMSESAKSGSAISESGAPARVDAAGAMARALKAPIARITAHANALLTGSGQTDPATLRAIQEQSQHAERVLQDVLAFTEPVSIQPEPQLLNYFLRRYFQGIADRLRWRGIRLEMHLAEGMPRVPLDRAAFEQVLLNLAANAAQSMGDLGGVLTVSTEASDAGVVVRVADSGRGVDAAIAATAFEPFVKGTDSGDGPGLGLTAARALIEAHGGAIALEQRAEGGAVCTLALPAAAHASKPAESTSPAVADETPAPVERPILRVVDVPRDEPAEPVATASPPPSRPSPAQAEPDPKRLLMADTDFELGELLHELLGRRGFEVVYLQDPAQALLEAVRAPYGQILVDAALSAPDGRPLAHALHDALPGARVILTVTPDSPAPGALEGDYALALTKPFPVRALLSALQAAPSPRG